MRATTDPGLRVRVLGSVGVAAANGEPLALKGPRHRELLGRLVVADGFAVPVEVLVADLWGEQPPRRAVGSIRTFVSDLRSALEPLRPPRTRPGILVSAGAGYALRLPVDAVDAWRAERLVAEAATATADRAARLLGTVLEGWGGTAYADVGDRPWVQAERARLDELRSSAVEHRATALLETGRPAEAVRLLDTHVAGHPWREEARRLLALALYRSGRQAEALDTVRRARTRLRDDLGLDPSAGLATLERDILDRAPRLDQPDDVFRRTAATSERVVGIGSRARLESTATLLRSLALSGGGGLEAAREHLAEALRAAEQIGDAETTARLLGGFEVPSIWPRSDDPHRSGEIAAAARRALRTLGTDAPASLRARLLAVIAIETRGLRGSAGISAAREAVGIADDLGDPALRCFALGALVVQSCDRPGRAAERDALGNDIVTLARRHDLPTYEIQGLLVRMQAAGALANPAGAARLADAVDVLAGKHERPLVHVFTAWNRAMRRAEQGHDDAETQYRRAADLLDGSGMHGVSEGLLPLALLALRIRRGQPLDVDLELDDGDRSAAAGAPDGTGFGPYEPWVRPLLLSRAGRAEEARDALGRLTAPPPGLLLEALWCLVAQAATEVSDETTLVRARTALEPARHEIAGAGSGMVSLGPVERWV
ncbi:BTAD domain-containing putative transcriptional regulator [Georgenia halophila]|uniref:BTAD domain-containing putative transcriptional regulator n=1 Tax=Georgenia halophila TaxID=620889 RepID=A0ABP8LAX2_9MICO